MNIIFVICICLFITFIGYTIIWGFKLLPEVDVLLVVAISYGLGVGAISSQLYLYSRLNIPWNRELLILPWLIILIILFIKNRKRIALSLPKLPKFKLVDKLLLIGILLTI